MNTAAHTTRYENAPRGWFSRTEAWLDERGKGAWIATMVVSFILFWPVGLALLAYMIWSKRMFSKSCSHRRNHDSQAWQDRHMSHRHGFASSGNTAFDAYKAETLRRLMSEQEAFEAFLERLRAAKDKSEFDQFMDERAEAARSSHIEDEDMDDDADDRAEDVEILDEPTRKKK
ncbi:Protein of unknown function [Aliiroseovarius halocynthiae]|uniref:DUF2852 domain-containing protein n=1 Tax=Aliiroseovarius halocynthiae TaxID=985055 RepID=A0A545SVL1_9RHOB|nr:DUF2852 domain-containing protein [Aliiroseovarius halocynthiae]TQV69002.1 DUF2852 domain-containing protein [Aliiroseovarius halocynthiae]SMR71751.1 Protein of unknown function [Aliiroseovarius halocynthiae]